MVMINPTPGQPDTPNNAPVAGAGTSPGGSGNVLGGLLGSLIGIKGTTISSVLNTLFYGSLTLIGGLFAVWGVYQLSKDVPALSGVSSVVGSAARKVGSVAKLGTLL
jgi:hypothetical protein